MPRTLTHDRERLAELLGTQCGLTTQTWSVPLKAFPYDKQWRDGTAVAEIETDSEGTPEWVAPASLSATVKVVTPRK